MIRAELKTLGRKYIRMGKDLTPEDQENLVRGMLYQNVIMHTDNGVMSAKQLGADKRGIHVAVGIAGGHGGDQGRRKCRRSTIRSSWSRPSSRMKAVYELPCYRLHFVGRVSKLTVCAHSP